MIGKDRMLVIVLIALMIGTLLSAVATSYLFFCWGGSFRVRAAPSSP